MKIIEIVNEAGLTIDIPLGTVPEVASFSGSRPAGIGAVTECVQSAPHDSGARLSTMSKGLR